MKNQNHRRYHNHRLYRLCHRDSQYNHVTAQLALAPVQRLPFRGLNVPPIEGYQLLAQIYHDEPTKE